MPKIVSILLVCITLVCPVIVPQAQSQPATPDSALVHILNSLEGTPLGLQECMQKALNNATSVQIAKAAYLAAEGASRREAGAFDPELFFNMNRVEQDQPAASFFSGASVLSTTQTTANGGLRMQLPIGTSIEASINTVDLKTNSAFAFLNPQYTAFGNLSVKQPILGGFHVSARKQSAKADRQLDAAKARYDQEVLATGTEIEQRYWDLYAAERDYAVQKLVRDRGEAFLKDTELRAKAGLVGPNQVANARTFLAEQEIFLLDREEAFDRLSDQLGSLMGERPKAGRYLTSDSPPDALPVEDVDVLVRQATDGNLALMAYKNDIEAARALSDASFWEALPSINLLGSLGGNGLAGTAQNVIFGGDTLRTTRGGSFSDALSQAVQRKFPAWSLGVEVNFPLTFRTGFGEQERLEAELVIAEQRYIQATRVLEEQVRSSYRDLSNGQRRLKAATEGVEAAQEQVRIGLIEFQNGRSTAFELVRLGTDFAVAQQRYSQAVVRSAKAAAALRLLTSGAYTGGKP